MIQVKVLPRTELVAAIHKSGEYFPGCLQKSSVSLLPSTVHYNARIKKQIGAGVCRAVRVDICVHTVNGKAKHTIGFLVKFCIE